ncbi:MAG: beta-1,6-N-acetylglucosaminyltransferase [Aliiglaciecola sp.]|uniref:beta-1,6-N-acetylglucosaminyltransferase n=1 Tax=Aliiglaciecola sp. TaxID=1872441 RepID=UPI00329A7D41
MMNKKLAYLILTHNDPVHLERLVNAIDYNADIYIHVDKKTNASQFSSLKNRCIFIENRVDISWADISMIDAQIELLRAAIVNSHLYTHMIFLSGSCYPIKNINEINEMFQKNRTKEFINFIDMRESPLKYMTHIKRKWFFRPLIRSDNLVTKFIDRAIRKLLRIIKFQNYWQPGIIPYFGSQWCALTPECASYVLDFHDQNPWFRDMNRHTMSPDEHYFHTIVGNSNFLEASGGVQEFEGDGTWRMANLHVIDKSLSKWFCEDDWNDIKGSEYFFVRKVRSKDGTSFVNKINKEILKIETCN